MHQDCMHVVKSCRLLIIEPSKIQTSRSNQKMKFNITPLPPFSTLFLAGSDAKGLRGDNGNHTQRTQTCNLLRTTDNHQQRYENTCTRFTNYEEEKSKTIIYFTDLRDSAAESVITGRLKDPRISRDIKRRQLVLRIAKKNAQQKKTHLTR